MVQGMPSIFPFRFPGLRIPPSPNRFWGNRSLDPIGGEERENHWRICGNIGADGGEGGGEKDDGADKETPTVTASEIYALPILRTAVGDVWWCVYSLSFGLKPEEMADTEK